MEINTIGDIYGYYAYKEFDKIINELELVELLATEYCKEKGDKESEQEILQLLATPICTDEVGFSFRQMVTLDNAGMVLVGDVCALSKEELAKKIRIRMGTKSFDDIIERIHSLGLHLRGEKIEEKAEAIEEKEESKEALVEKILALQRKIEEQQREIEELKAKNK